MDPRAYFSDKAEAYRTSKSHANEADLARMLALLARHGVSVGPGTRALDVATGGGPTAIALARAGAETVPSDVTREMLHAVAATAREQGLPLAARVMAAAQALPFRDGSFRVVASRIAPHHFPDLPAFAREAARVLEPGGLLYVFDLTTPDGHPGAREVINRVERLRDPSHVDSYPPQVWRDALTGAGLEVHHLASTVSEFDLEPWIRRAQMPPEREHALRALLAEPPVDLHGYGLVPGGKVRVLRVEVVAGVGGARVEPRRHGE